jgi:cyanophycin synthetase
VANTELGPSTQAIVDAAERRGIPWYRHTEGSFVQLGYGAQRRYILATQTERTSIVAVETACDKALAKRLLDEAAIPVPRGVVVRTREEAVAAMGELNPPLVVKPLDGNQGKGVSLRLRPASVCRRTSSAMASAPSRSSSSRRTAIRCAARGTTSR